MPLTGTSACPLETEMRAAAVCLVHGPGPDVSKVRTYVHTVGLHAGVRKNANPLDNVMPLTCMRNSC